MQTSGQPAAATAAALVIPPRIGQLWPAAGGIYLGLTPSLTEGEPDEHLVRAVEIGTSLTWQQAMDWAQALRAGGFDDWQLGDRTEGALDYAHTRDLEGNKDWCWLRTQYSRDNAWFQDFDYGFQYFLDKKYEAAARAFRRFKVQSLSPSFLASAAMAEHAAALRSVACVMTNAADQIDCARSRAAAAEKDEAGEQADLAVRRLATEGMM